MAVEHKYSSTPLVRLNERIILAMTGMSTPVSRWISPAFRAIVTLVVVFAPIAGLTWISSSERGEDPRIAYALASPDNVITRLQSRIDKGQTALTYDGKRGYLPSVLKALHISISSQMLVFSKTSVQKELISPRTPRALYFGDDAYIGYLPDSRSLEVAVNDPQLGPVYYVLLQKQQNRPLFFRTVAPCLECHATTINHYIPQHIMRSVVTDTDGELTPHARSFATDDTSPIAQRWGGWYVTGRRGSQQHMGNSFVKPNSSVTTDTGQGETITDLRHFLETSPFLTPHSDIVALMVLGHQTHLQNLIIQAAYETKVNLLQRKSADYAAGAPRRIKEACEPLLRALLFQNETTLKSPISGTAGFAEQFSAEGPHDQKNRSLRQLDLKRRLFRYPCSFTIYSEAFDALPDPAKNYLFHRLREVLTVGYNGKDFAYLSATDRKAIREILIDTKPAFAARIGKR